MGKSYKRCFKRLIRGFLLLTVLGNGALAQEHSYAKSLFTIAKFSGLNVEGEQFTITVIGSDLIANDLIHISKNEEINGKRIHIQGCETLDQIGTPQILFVPASKSDMLPVILDKTSGKPVIIVTEKSGQVLGNQRHKPTLCM